MESNDHLEKALDEPGIQQQDGEDPQELTIQAILEEIRLKLTTYLNGDKLPRLG